MKKTVLTIIALFGLALGATGITSVLADQNVKSESILSELEMMNLTNQSEGINTQNGLNELMNSRTDNEAIVQTLATTPSFEGEMVEPISLEEPEKKVEESENTVSYTVESGDTLIHIATAFEVEVNELIKQNEQLTEDTPLQIGEVVQIETDLDPETIKPQKIAWENEEAEESQIPLSEMNLETSAVEEEHSISTADTEEKLTVVATAYSRNQPSLTNITATGIDLRDNPQVIAVDPDVIPLGTKVYVEGYGEAIAGDTGSAINGKRVDLHMESIDESFAWGIQEVELTILD